jgi:hypothetical protein
MIRWAAVGGYLDDMLAARRFSRAAHSTILAARNAERFILCTAQAILHEACSIALQGFGHILLCPLG